MGLFQSCKKAGRSWECAETTEMERKGENYCASKGKFKREMIEADGKKKQKHSFRMIPNRYHAVAGW